MPESGGEGLRANPSRLSLKQPTEKDFFSTKVPAVLYIQISIQTRIVYSLQVLAKIPVGWQSSGGEVIKLHKR